MDSIFGRKKRTKGPSGEILTSSGAGGSSTAEVIGNSMTPRMNVSAPSGMRHVGGSGMTNGNPNGDYPYPYPSPNRIHAENGDEFGTSRNSPSSHRRVPSAASSSVRSVGQRPTDYGLEPHLHQTRYAPSTMTNNSLDSNGNRYPTMTSDILNRMSISSAASASLGMGPGLRHPSNEAQYLMQGGPSLPRESSSHSGFSRTSANSSTQLPSHVEGKAEFIMQRPDDAEIERMFAELMNKRDFLGLPSGNISDDYKEAARRNMMNFPVHKKWMLVYNDKFTEFHAEKERERTRRNHQQGQPGGPASSNMVITRNSPEWYIKKFMDGSVTTKHIESLAVTLRTCAMGWVENFVDAKGTPVLASFLNGLHAKGSAKSDTDMALEYEVLKAFRSLFNSKAGANDALKQPKCVNSIVHSIISAHLATRKQAADILLFLCHWAMPAGHQLVLRGFDELKSSQSDHGRFDAWFRILEQTIDGRGQMGSKVGQSEEIRKISMLGHQEASLNEYAVNNMFLVNAILSSRIVSDYQVRVHLRNQMEASGLQRILIKMRAFKNTDLDRQLDEYEKGAELDQDNVVESFNKEVLTDMSDPVDVFKAIVGKISGSRAYDFFLSGLQHLLLIRQDGESLVHYYQLIDSMISAVVMDKKGAVEGNDMSSLLGVSVNNVLSRFADQDAMIAIKDELQKAKLVAREAQTEKQQLEQQLNETSEGLVGKLQERVSELEGDLDVSRSNSNAMQRDMEDMEKGYVDRIVALEVEKRELYDMLKEAQGAAEIAANGAGNMDRQQLVETLEKQMERNKTIRKLEANAKKNGQIAKMTSEQEDAVREREKRLSRKRLSKPSLRDEALASAIDDEEDEADETRLESSSESELDPNTDAGKWKIQATLAAGMARNADLQSRMTDAKETRRRKGSRSSSNKATDSIAPLSSPLDVGNGNDPPPPPPPPPPPQAAGGTSSTFLDEIRKRKATGLRNASSGSGEMGPPPPPPPPPPMPGVRSSAFSNSDSSRPPSVISAATGDIPPPPPPPPPAVGTPLRTGTPVSNTPIRSLDSTPAINRDSMLNVRASVSSTIGPSGPIHAPPAPPSFYAANMVMRKEVSDTAKQRMKQLQWDKLTPQHAAETIWGQNAVSEEELAVMLREQGLFNEMEEDFKAKQITKRATQTAKKEKMEFKTHLTLQTRQGIEMVLRRVKSSLTDAKHATPEEVAHHIVNCNEAVLDQSFLEELLRHYPESEVKGQLGEYRNASDEELRLLHPADRLVVLLMTVPHLKDKVKGLLFLTKYREAIELIKEGSLRVRDGSEDLMKAQNFAKLLSLILMMGNFLNSNGMQGGAFGFKISSINKLVDTKASDGTTLLHFVERTISRCFPETEAFLEELEKPSEACRVQLLDLKRDLAELKSGSLQHKKELDKFLDESEDRLEDPYTKVMLPFLNDVHSELTRLTDQVQFSERVYIDALRYFGEGPDPKRRGFPAPQPMRTEDFFGIFREFSAAYRKVKQDNVHITELRNAEAKRRAAAEERERERQEAIKRKEAGVDDSAVLETLLTSLRSGGVTPKRKRKTQQRGGRESGRDSTGQGDTSGGANQSAGEAVSMVASSSIDGNPSDVAQAMLAKLQGGESSNLSSSENRGSSSYVSRRRRERRTTQGGQPSNVRSLDDGQTAVNEDEELGHRQSVSENSREDSSRPSIDRTNSAPERPPRRSNTASSADMSARNPYSQHEHRSRTNSQLSEEGSSYSANTGQDAEYDGDHREDREVDEEVDDQLTPAAQRMLRLDSHEQLRRSQMDEAAMQRDASGEYVFEQGEWFDPDGSAFVDTSTGSAADRTARP